MTGTVGIPGTGLSYRERLDKPTERPEVPTIEQEVAKPINGWKILAILLAAVLVIILLKWL